MMQTGALGTMMTSSGSSIFSLFDDIKKVAAWNTLENNITLPS